MNDIQATASELVAWMLDHGLDREPRPSRDLVLVGCGLYLSSINKRVRYSDISDIYPPEVIDQACLDLEARRRGSHATQ